MSEQSTMEQFAHFMNQLVKTYQMVGAETKRGIQVRKIVDTYLSKEFVDSTSPESTNQLIMVEMKKKMVANLK